MGHSLGRRNLLEINNLAVFQKMQSEAERPLNSAKAITGFDFFFFFFLVCTTEGMVLLITNIDLAAFVLPWGFPGSSDSKRICLQRRTQGLIPGLGRGPGEGNDCPLQDSCLGNPMNRGAWWAAVRGVTKTWT